MQNMRVRSIDTIPMISSRTATFTDLVTGKVTNTISIPPEKGGNGVKATMSDVVTPGFRREMAQGHVVNNDMTLDRFTISRPVNPYWTRSREYYDGALVSGTLLSVDGGRPATSWLVDGHAQCVDMTPSARTALRATISVPGILTGDQLLVKSLAKAAETDVMALVTLAEAQKTLDSIAEASRVFSRISQYIRRSGRKVFTPRGLFRATGDGLRVWLEVRYGLLPTYYEILGYAKRAQSVGKRARVRFVSNSEGTGVANPVVNTWSGHYGSDVHTTYRSLSVRRSAGCLVEPFAINIDPIHSLGMDRLASTGWELIPFSFVVDWFLNTSQIIAAHEGRFGQRVLATWIVDRQTMLSSYTRHYVDGEWWSSDGRRHRVGTAGIANSASEVWESVSRKTGTQVPVLPSLQIRLDWKKCVDLAALAGGVGNNLSKLVRF